MRLSIVRVALIGLVAGQIVSSSALPAHAQSKQRAPSAAVLAKCKAAGDAAVREAEKTTPKSLYAPGGLVGIVIGTVVLTAGNAIVLSNARDGAVEKCLTGHGFQNMKLPETTTATPSTSPTGKTAPQGTESGKKPSRVSQGRVDTSSMEKCDGPTNYTLRGGPCVRSDGAICELKPASGQWRQYGDCKRN